MHVDLDNAQTGHGLDRGLDVLLHFLCHITNVVAEQCEEADLYLNGIIVAEFDTDTLGQILFTDKADNVARQAGIQTADTLGFRGRQCCDRRNNILRDTDRALIAFGGPVLLVICHSAHSPFLRQSHHPVLSKSIIAQFV